MRRLRWFSPPMVALAVLVMLGGSVRAQTDVTVTPGTSTVDVGQQFSISIAVSNVNILHGISDTLMFDHGTIQFQSATEGAFLQESGQSTAFLKKLLVGGMRDTLIVDQAILGPYAVTGTGTVIVATFTALLSGTHQITLNAALRDISNQDIPASMSGGSVVVRPTSARLKVFLAGPYTGAGAMSTALVSSGLLPLTHPYGGSPWNHTGSESVAGIPAGIVDWMLLELRTGTAAATAVATRAAFLKNDGTVVDLNGSSFVGFPSILPGNYYVVIRHRNHLAVMSAAPVALSGSSALYDFTTGASQAFGTDLKDLGDGAFGMWSGDVNADGTVKYSGSSNDRLPILSVHLGGALLGTATGYYPEDVTMDGIVKYSGAGNDRLPILTNLGGNLLGTKTSHVPN